MADQAGDARRSRSERMAERHREREARSTERRARRANRTGRPDRQPLTSDRIADAAIAIIDREGLESLTLRRLAVELDVGTMTLYWYVRDKDELLDLVRDRIIGDVAIPDDGRPWPELVFEAGISLRRVLLAHPGTASLVDTRPSMGPRGAAVLDKALGIFATSGLDPEMIASAYSTVSNYVSGYAVWQVSNGLQSSVPPEERLAVVSDLRAFIAALPEDRFPNLRRLGPYLFGGDLDARFEFGLRAIVDGIVAAVARRASAAPNGSGGAPLDPNAAR